MLNNLAIIIGAMKAGTTTLFDHLAKHPAIAGAQPKEPGYFAFEEIYARGPDWYEGLFDFDPARHKYALDASTDYSKYPHCGDVAARIDAHPAPAKLIYIMRHPLRRLESHARHVQFARKELGQIPSPIPDHGLDHGVSPVSMDASRYAMQLDQYEHYVARGDLMLTSLERLSRKPAETVREVFAFLDLDPAAAPASVEKRNSADEQRVNAAHPLWALARSVGPLRAAVKAAIPDTVRERWRSKARPRAKVEGRFQFTAEEEARILAALTPDLRRLRDIYGFDIEDEWGIKV